MSSHLKGDLSYWYPQYSCSHRQLGGKTPPETKPETPALTKNLCTQKLTGS